jgi:CMP-N-acetylneuraminic acid synthetase
MLYKKKPLLFHSIKTALKLKKINKVLVSTDSEKYKLLAKNYGADVVLRPKKISQDNSLEKEFLVHAFNYLRWEKNYKVDLFVLFRPTCPDRDINDLKKALNISIKNFKKYTSVRSAHMIHNPAQKNFKIKGKYFTGFFNKTLKGEYHSYPRQIYPITYSPNGFFDVLKPQYFMKFKSKKKLWGNKIFPIITKFYKDIDTKNDL